VTGLSDLTRESARDAAREELSRREYSDAQPPLLIRLVGRALRAFGDLLDSAALAVPGGRLGLVLLLGLLLLLVAVVVARVRPESGRGRSRAPLFAGSAVLSAAEHRELAEQAAGEGRFEDAVRERLRAVVRDLEARGVLDPRPGRTAGEIARDGGAAVPAVAEDLRRAAGVFDEVWYGGRAADASSYAVLVGVDERVARSRLAAA
jgi:hypothetical protein